MQLKACIDESDIGRIRPGQHVRFRVDAYPGEEFSGTVSQIRLQPVVQQNVVSYQTIASVRNPQLKLKPGMTANVTVEIARQDNALRVSAAALRFRPTAEMFAALDQTPPEGTVGARAAAERPAQRSTASDSSSGNGAELGAGGGMGRRGNAQGGGPGGGQWAGMSDEERAARRQAFMERMAQMSPEEREQYRQRMQSRREQQGGEPQRGATQGASGSDWLQASSIDALFGPVETPVRPARVWIYVNGQLKPVSVRVGLGDATNAALVDGPLQEGATVVTGVTMPTTARASSSGSPLLPSFGRFRGPGGGGGQRR